MRFQSRASRITSRRRANEFARHGAWRPPWRRAPSSRSPSAAAATTSPRAAARQSSGGDTGETITMWTRAATQTQSERLVKAYNDSHENQVELTVIPTDNYQARVAAAAGGKNLPDVFASDVIYAPNYTSQGLYLDITDRIDSLDFADALAPAHMRLGTYEDAQVHGPAHARPVGPVLEQGPLQEGRARSRDAADNDEGVRRARQDDPREGRRQDVRHVLRRQLPRLLRLHLLAVGVGRGRRHHERGRDRSRRSTTRTWPRPSRSTTTS